METNPWDHQEWHALNREAQLAALSSASGVTLLGKANHAQKGNYIKAFFDLSIGIERLGKLILICDHCIENAGRFPSDKILKDLGHDLLSIKTMVSEISSRRNISDRIAIQPNDKIHEAILICLNDFARSTRYYNLDRVISGVASNKKEPISNWWNTVVSIILERHYKPSLRERDEAQAKMLDGIFGGKYVSVLHFSENEEILDSLEAVSKLGGATRLAQKFGQLYVLQIIRWMSHVLSELSVAGAYTHRMPFLLGLDEPGRIFYNRDSFFKSRKTWSIY